MTTAKQSKPTYADRDHTATVQPASTLNALDQLKGRFTPVDQLPGFTASNGDADYLRANGVHIGIHQGVAVVRFTDTSRAVDLIAARRKA
jgi:hypothetical protein